MRFNTERSAKYFIEETESDLCYNVIIIPAVESLEIVQ